MSSDRRSGFRGRRGTTFVELMMVCALCGAILWGMYSFFINMKSRDEALTRDQEFAQLEARLVAALKQDLRTATEVHADGPDRWRLKRLVPGDQGAETEDVTWTRAPGGRTVTRAGRVTYEYDFSKLLEPGKRLRFEIQ